MPIGFSNSSGVPAPSSSAILVATLRLEARRVSCRA